MARVRNYAAEQAAREAKARESGYKSYHFQRRALEKSKAEAYNPNSAIRRIQGDSPAASEEDAVPRGVGGQGPESYTPDEDWDYYWPTRTINAMRPRTTQARYSRNLERLEIMFARTGNYGDRYMYEKVPPSVWNKFKRNASPGRFINAVLNNYTYQPGGWGD